MHASDPESFASYSSRKVEKARSGSARLIYGSPHKPLVFARQHQSSASPIMVSRVDRFSRDFCTDGQLVGLLNRNALLSGQTLEQAQRPAETVNPDATIREAVSRMIDKSVSLLVVTLPADGKPDRNRHLA
jgi:hypothetical protein